MTFTMQMVWGTRTAFKTGLVVTIATLIIGVVIGSISAYYGGLVDNVIMRIVDIFLHSAGHPGGAYPGGCIHT